MSVKTRPLTDALGRRLEHGRLLGRGGEGAVYEVVGAPELVAKIYHQPLTSERAEKIKVMATMASSELVRFCAWPAGLLMDGGQPRGLLMPRVASRNELHNLHGPKSRKAEFPDAGFDFLIHVALNIARAFARLHAMSVIIGDVNDRGIMVASDGTVRLIDCDSFQISTPRKTFHCGVGVPEYTPPELQGQALGGRERTENHDVFGLAVLVFRLLFMGRHPFAGIYQAGHKEIHEAIRETRYAYARDAARTRMQPPPNMLTVADGAGASIANLFERAFAPGAGARPAAPEWVAALDGLRSNLVNCSFNSAHAYIRNLAACPWCELEQRFNVDFFHFIPAGSGAAQSIDLEAVWQAIGALSAPNVPRPISEALVRRQPRPPPPSLVKLRDEAASLAAEARRARWVAAQMLAAAEKKQIDVDSFIANLATSDGEIERLEQRLLLLKGPERRYLMKGVLIGLSVVMLAAALHFASPHFFFLAIGIYAAMEGSEALLAWMRTRMAGRVERRLEAARRAIIQADPELRGQFDAIQEIARAAGVEAQRTDDIAAALERAGADAQSEFARESRVEIEARDRQLKLAEDNAETARKSLAGLASAAKALTSAIDERRRRLAPSQSTLTQLTRQRDAEYQRLRDHDRATQLHRFLDSQYINRADIKGITPSLKSALESFSIETAADVSQVAVLNVPGFGKVRTQRMLDWRNHVARKFRYRPGAEIDPAQRKAVENKYAAGRLRVARDFTTAQTELERRIRELGNQIAVAKRIADDAIGALAQARADRQVLDVG